MIVHYFHIKCSLPLLTPTLTPPSPHHPLSPPPPVHSYTLLIYQFFSNATHCCNHVQYYPPSHPSPWFFLLRQYHQETISACCAAVGTSYCSSSVHYVAFSLDLTCRIAASVPCRACCAVETFDCLSSLFPYSAAEMVVMYSPFAAVVVPRDHPALVVPLH